MKADVSNCYAENRLWWGEPATVPSSFTKPPGGNNFQQVNFDIFNNKHV